MKCELQCWLECIVDLGEFLALLDRSTFSGLNENLGLSWILGRSNNLVFWKEQGGPLLKIELRAIDSTVLNKLCESGDGVLIGLRVLLSLF